LLLKKLNDVNQRKMVAPEPTSFAIKDGNQEFEQLSAGQLSRVN
jgi:hypothetical protein